MKKRYDVRSVNLGLLQANLCFKFAESGKIRRIWNTLMQFWITVYRGFLLEAVWLFVDSTSCLEQQVAVVRVESLN